MQQSLFNVLYNAWSVFFFSLSIVQNQNNSTFNCYFDWNYNKELVTTSESLFIFPEAFSNDSIQSKLIHFIFTIKTIRSFYFSAQFSSHNQMRNEYLTVANKHFLKCQNQCIQFEMSWNFRLCTSRCTSFGKT